VQRWSRRSFMFIGCICLVLAGAAAAFACMSHATLHPVAYPHPLLCLDASTPVEHNDGGPTLATEGRKVRSPARLPMTVGYPANIAVQPSSSLHLPSQGVSWTYASTQVPASVSLRPNLRL
jgi:hypothetical protein